MSRSSSRPSGFVFIAALFFVMLAGVVVMSVSRGFAAQAARTRAQGQQAQLEQILLAGRDIVNAGNATPDLSAALPDDLRHGGYQLTYSPQQRLLTAAVGKQVKTLALPSP